MMLLAHTAQAPGEECGSMMQAAELAVLDWLQALRLGGVDPEKIEAELPYAGILLKKNEDLTAVKNAKNRVKNGFRW